MVHPSLPSESVDAPTSRRDAALAAVCTVTGILAIMVAPGVENMIAGSVGSVGAGCLAVGLTFLDERLSYWLRVQACLPIVLMLMAAGVGIRAHALSLAGYPLLLLGLGGLVPMAIRWANTNAVPEPRLERPTPEHATSHIMSNSGA